jgi:hypothetical protein
MVMAIAPFQRRQVHLQSITVFFQALGDLLGDDAFAIVTTL